MGSFRSCFRRLRGALLFAAVLAAAGNAAHAATFRVDDLGDGITAFDSNPGNGEALAATNTTPLRAAIMEANALAGADVIEFDVTGTITLQLPLFQITDDLTIRGPGLSSLTIDGQEKFTVFFVDSGVTFEASQLSVVNGVAQGGSGGPGGGGGGGGAGMGGGLFVNGGTVTLEFVAFRNCVAVGGGGGRGTSEGGFEGEGSEGEFAPPDGEPSIEGSGGFDGEFTFEATPKANGADEMDPPETGGDGGDASHGLGSGGSGGTDDSNGGNGGFGAGGGGGWVADDDYGSGGNGGFGAGGGGAGTYDGTFRSGGIGGAFGGSGGFTSSSEAGGGGGGGGAGLGGAIFARSGTTRLIDCVFEKNRAAGRGGGRGEPDGGDGLGKGAGIFIADGATVYAFDPVFISNAALDSDDTPTDNNDNFGDLKFPPRVRSIVRTGTSPTNAGTVDFEVTFSHAVTGAGADDFSVVTGAVKALSGASVSQVSGVDETRTVTVNTGSGSGTLGLRLDDNDSIEAAGTGLPLGSPGNGNGSFEGSEPYTIDTAAPVITLFGANPDTADCGSGGYVDPGAAASDNLDGNLTATVDVEGTVNTAVPGAYTLAYSVPDTAGNTTTVERTVNVVDTQGPQLTLLGSNPAAVECSAPYVDAGATATDLCGGTLTPLIAVDASAVDTAVPGTYAVDITVTDDAGNTAMQQRTVEVVDTTKPSLTLLGETTLSWPCNTPYSDPGATAFDDCDGDLTASVAIDTSNVDVSQNGSYLVALSVTDAQGNQASAVRTVNIIDCTTGGPGGETAEGEPAGDGENTGPTAVLALLTDGNGQVFADPAGPLYPTGTVVELISVPNAGWRFDRWDGDVAEAKQQRTQVTMNRDKTVTAVFLDGLLPTEGETAPEGEQEGEGEGGAPAEGEGGPAGGEGDAGGEGGPAGGEGDAGGEGGPVGGEGEDASEGSADGEGRPEGAPGAEGAPDGEAGPPEGEGEAGGAEGLPGGEGQAEEGEAEPGEGEGAGLQFHSADPNGDSTIDLGELLRVIQLYNAGAHSCAASQNAGADGFAPGAGPRDCPPHASDYRPQDWRIDLAELLRAIQLFSFGEYRPCPGQSEDGFCPETT